MRIGIVTTWFERGAAYVSRAYRDVLVEAGHDVYIFARGGENRGMPTLGWDQDFVTWGHYFEESAMRIDEREFKSWLECRGIEIILYNEQQSWEAVLFANKCRIPSVAYVDYYTKETVPFFDLYDGLICNTKRHYSVFESHPGSIYIPWGTDVDIFKPMEDKLDRNSIVFFHSAGMGGLGMRKGTDLLLRAFSQVKGNAKLIIHSQVSANSLGDCAKYIEDDPRVDFIHKTVSAPGLYSLGDIYVYPSRLDGIGLTIAEALASGLAVITTDSAPMNEFVVTGCNGSLVDVERSSYRFDDYFWPETECSIAHLTETMQKYVDNPDRVNTEKDAARQFALDRLSWNKNSKNILSFFEKMADVKVVSKKYLPVYDDAIIKSLWDREEKYQKIRSIFYRLKRKLRRMVFK
tara:strand:+ start:24830 stop:26047 length:1218 start_codon:yes stop_codon:yes gene_type:complete